MESLEAEALDIFVNKGKLTVKAFQMSDREVASYFEDIEPEDREERLGSVIRTGVIALKAVGITEKIDYIQKEFMRLNSEFSESLEKAETDLDEKFEEIFGEKGKFSEIVKEHFGEDGKVVKELFDPARQGSPLNILRNEIRQEISELKTELKLETQREEIEQKTPLKGAKFEDFCESVLSEIARVNGDKLQRTSEEVGKLRPSKKGDFVIELKANSQRIVYEMKDTGKLTFPNIYKSIDEAMQNRDAVYGVFLVKNVESLPQSVGWFNEYDGNKLICALGSVNGDDTLHEEILQISYKWAKTKVMLESMKGEDVDSEFIKNKVTGVQAKLAELNKVKTNCRSIEESTKDIRNIADELQDQIGRDLSEVISSLTS
ncbi:MAG TPA: hypothetical protein VF172_11075 [Nitrososphaera sp.]